jgi:hypothetical protein
MGNTQQNFPPSRILHKHDIEVNWNKAKRFIPKQSELIIYDIEVDAEGNTLSLPSDRKTPYLYERFKIGDGITNVVDLPFAMTTLGGTKTTALSLNSFASGFGTIGGGRGFKIISQNGLEGTDGCYELSSVDGIQELLDAGEVLQYGVRLSSVSYAKGIITSVVGNWVNVTNFDSSLTLKDETDFNPPEEDRFNPDEKPTVANYFVIIGHPELGDRDIGFNSVAFGENTMATDRSAAAFGRDTKAIGEFSFAEGYGTMAIYASHAEGKHTKALGETSHTEGYKTEAHGSKSHAEGSATKAMGDASHAEGSSYQVNGATFSQSLEAKGYASHAEGGASQTGENAHYAHAEGE